MFSSSLPPTSERQGTTRIVRPSSGKSVKFSLVIAGDFFTYEGRLYLKLDLQNAKEITVGEPSFGLTPFAADRLVQAENVEIKIL